MRENRRIVFFFILVIISLSMIVTARITGYQTVGQTKVIDVHIGWNYVLFPSLTTIINFEPSNLHPAIYHIKNSEWKNIILPIFQPNAGYFIHSVQEGKMRISIATNQPIVVDNFANTNMNKIDVSKLISTIRPFITITSPTEEANVTTATSQIQFRVLNAIGRKIKVFVDFVPQTNFLDSLATSYTTPSLTNGFTTVHFEVVETNGTSLTPRVISQFRNFYVKHLSFPTKKCTKWGEVICKPGNILTFCKGIDQEQESRSKTCPSHTFCSEKHSGCMA